MRTTAVDLDMVMWKKFAQSYSMKPILAISLCLKFEDIFCFCVENLCGHQTIGWLVKFRGRTFESFFDINMRCIKILF